MRNPFNPVRVLLLAAVCTIVPAARAETVTADFAGVDPGQAVSVTLNHQSLKNIAAGTFNWINVDPSNTFLGSAFQSYCIELNVGVMPRATFTTQGLSPRYDATTAARLREFWGENFSKVTDGNTAAAFQLGLWEIVHEAPGTTLDVTAKGSPNDTGFRADVAPNGIIPTAQSWLNNVNGTGTFEDGLVVLDSVDSQDQITRHIIPVPPAVILGGMGLVSLVGYGIRRRRLAKAAAATA